MINVIIITIIMLCVPAEVMWEQYRNAETMDDQIKMNYALHSMNITWNHTIHNDPSNNTWQGHASAGLSVSVLPQRFACRGNSCTNSVRAQCYIWHKGSHSHLLNDVVAHVTRVNMWHLRSGWNETQNSGGTALEWLTSVRIDYK